MCIQYNKVHIINTRIKSTEDRTKKFKTYFHCGPLPSTIQHCKWQNIHYVYILLSKNSDI